MTRTQLCKVSTTLTHPDAGIKRYVANCRPFCGRLFALTGLAGQAYVAFQHTVDVANTVVMERVFYHIIGGVAVLPTRPGTDQLSATLAPALDAFRRVCVFTAVWSFDDFVNSVHGRKRTLYANCAKRLEQGWSWRDVSNWCKYRAFIKHEKLPIVEGKRLVPRLIQPRSPEYNVLVGRYIKAAEKPIYHTLTSIAADVSPVVGKGMDAFDLADCCKAKWDRFVQPVCVGFDQSRFDQHISRAALEFEHRWYTTLFHSKELSRLLSYQLTSSGTVICNDGAVKYKTEGGRGSGDMNTGLGNTILQFSLMFSYVHRVGLQGRVSYLVNGDDSLLILERDDVVKLDGFAGFCEALGFVLKVEAPVTVFERISFCQMQPVWNGERYVFCRAFPTAFNKDVHTTFALTRENYIGYYAAVGECGLAIAHGIPVFQAFYQWLSSFGTPLALDYELGGMYHWRGGSVARITDVAEESRFSFYLAFGVLPEHQIAIENGFAYRGLPDWRPDLETCIIPDADLGVQEGV